jgi:dipeptidyl aminopeptidase/acylaminoacyl peptidase
VVLVHGGPWVRDTWGFDPLVQLLANRGYAVLQVNYRGSTGFGDELFRKARRQIGREVQDDIEDGTRWAIAAGVANPKRIAIMGSSYGGYSTLFGLGHNAELYRCGISLFGMTDWLAFFEQSDIADYKVAKLYWHGQLGDPAKDKVDLRAISPVNFAEKITAPLLIIQGEKDQRVPPDQAKRMIDALTKVGRKPESLFMANLGHTYGNEKERTEIYKAVVAFLEKNLGPGVP